MSGHVLCHSYLQAFRQNAVPWIISVEMYSRSHSGEPNVSKHSYQVLQTYHECDFVKHGILPAAYQLWQTLN